MTSGGMFGSGGSDPKTLLVPRVPGASGAPPIEPDGRKATIGASDDCGFEGLRQAAEDARLTNPLDSVKKYPFMNSPWLLGKSMYEMPRRPQLATPVLMSSQLASSVSI